MTNRILRPVRIVVRLTPIAVVAMALTPLQMLCVRLGLPPARWIPVLFHRCACYFLRVRVTIKGDMVSDRPLMIAANHCSWLDISVIGSIAPLCFVAKSEVADWPIFGLFAKLQRSVFVERERRTRTGAVAGEMGARMAAGDAIVLFPEGTSDNGIRVYPFRSALLGAVREAMREAGADRVDVQPMAVVYHRRNGLPIGHADMPTVAWYGDMDLAPHLLDIAAGGPIDVTVVFEPSVTADATTNRKALARNLETTVRAAKRSVLKETV